MAAVSDALEPLHSPEPFLLFAKKGKKRAVQQTTRATHSIAFALTVLLLEKIPSAGCEDSVTDAAKDVAASTNQTHPPRAALL